MNEQKTVRVRIAVVTAANGEWASTPKASEVQRLAHIAERRSGASRVEWLEAEVPLPVEQVVRGRVEPETLAEVVVRDPEHTCLTECRHVG